MTAPTGRPQGNEGGTELDEAAIGPDGSASQPTAL